MGLLSKFNKLSARKIGIALMPLSALALSTSCMNDPDTFVPPTVDEVIENSGGLLTAEQALQRIENAKLRHKEGLNNYLVTRKDPGEYYKNCFQMDYNPDQVPQPSKVYYTLSEGIRTSTGTLSKAFKDYAIKADIFFCMSAELDENYIGIWRSNSDGVVHFNDKEQYQSQTLFVTIHETLHAIQNDNGLSNEPNDIALADLQIGRLSREAAAMAAERIYSFENHLNGIDKDWKSNSRGAILDRVIEAEYNKQIENNMPHQRALEMAGAAAWKAVFTQQWWLNNYNINVAQIMINRYKDGKLKKLAPENYDISSARKTGQVNTSINFTRDLQDLPDVKSRFGFNGKMVFLFQYLELVQYREANGQTDPKYIQLAAKAVADKNPYLNVDLHKIDTSDKSTIIAQMDDLAAKARALKTNKRAPARAAS